MTIELTILTLAALWQVVHFVLFSVAAQRQVGWKYAASPRDEPRELTGMAGRLKRAKVNHFEALILFAIAVLITVYADKGDATSALCALTFLGARVLYLPAYAFGLAPWRSLIWLVGLGATVTMLVQALL